MGPSAAELCEIERLAAEVDAVEEQEDDEPEDEPEAAAAES